MRSANIWLIILASVIAAGTIIAAVIFTFIRNPEPSMPLATAAVQLSSEPEMAELDVDQQIDVVLFFQSPGQTDRLVPVKRKIFNLNSMSQQVSQTIQQLIAGPESGEEAYSTIPRGVSLLRCYLSEKGIAYVVFSPQISDNHPGGTTSELATIYSIVNTLCVNFPSIQAVQILVEDRMDSTLAGHIDITKPLTLDTEFFFTSPNFGDDQQEEEPQAQADGELQPSGESAGE